MFVWLGSNHARVVIKELTSKSCYFDRDAVGIFDVVLTELLKHRTKSIIPSLPVLWGISRIGSSQFHQNLLAYAKCEVSLRTQRRDEFDTHP